MEKFTFTKVEFMSRANLYVISTRNYLGGGCEHSEEGRWPYGGMCFCRVQESHRGNQCPQRPQFKPNAGQVCESQFYTFLKTIFQDYCCGLGGAERGFQ